jgi:hypothetical protein
MNELRKKKILLVDLGALMGCGEYCIEKASGNLRERETLGSLCVLPELACACAASG